jgi:peptide/nickel transport system ATP-binding protein
MDIVGLARRLENSYPHELDGGRRQRIGIGRALMLNPKFIVCDEPVSALDVSIQAQILNLMQDLQKERQLTYMFITHNLAVVKHISNEIIVMYLGMIVEKAETKELFQNQYHPYTKALISAIPRIKTEKRQERIILKGEITSPINPPDACRFANRCVYAQEKCFCCAPKAEEVTPKHIVACHYAKEINGLN